MLLKDKVIIVTGGSRGIGLSIAEHCLEHGAQVLIHGLEQHELHQAQIKLANKVEIVVADLLQPDAPEKIFTAAVNTFGQVDGLVNNAGIYPRSHVDDSDELFDQVMTINARAPMNLIKQLVKLAKVQQKRASVVNIGSINAYCGQPDLLVYSMSKGALMTMTRNLADALNCDGIRVNQLNVGWTATENEISLKQKEGYDDDWQQKIPAVYAPNGQILQPEQIAPHVTFWLSDWSYPVSGAVYEVEQYPLIGRNRLNDLTL